MELLDEFEHGFGWRRDEFVQRTSHAVLADGGVWVLDPVADEGIEERIRTLGEPAGVVQLLDRHERDCAELAERLGVLRHVTPFTGVPGAPFRVIPIVRRRTWKEVALWFEDVRTLVCADALGSAGYFRAANEPFGVHPFLRLFPPKGQLGDLEPDHILFGHGPGAHGPHAPAQLREALYTSRRRLGAALIHSLGPSTRRSRR